MNNEPRSVPPSLIDLVRNGVGNCSALSGPSGKPLQYADLERQIGYVGAALRKAGATNTDTVVLVLPNGPSMASCFLGVAACSACAPLNPQFGTGDFEFYISDIKPAAIVLPAGIDSPARGIARDHEITVLELEMKSDARAGEFLFSGYEASLNLDGGFSCNDDIALMLHTSGTTSRPKMVPLSHRNLCSSAASIANTLDLTSVDSCLNVMPLFHIHGLVGVLLSSLYAGAKVICTDGFDSDQFPGWLSACRPTWYSAVPTIHQSVLSAVRTTSGHCEHCLRLIRSSSSALPPRVMAELESTFGVPVIESYGMTEASHQMASNPLPPAKRIPGSVGRAAGPEISIMNDDGELLDSNQVGEIVIRGPSVTGGYLENPDANAIAFTNGWFRTGDLGKVDEDGYIFISGRIKEIINCGGEKISPREIDETLLKHDAVQQAVAFAMPHPTLGEDLAAAVVLRGENQTSEAELRKFLSERIVPFKVPSRILVVTSIPKTKGPTGKLQRIGLFGALEEQFKIHFVEPRTDLERSVVRVFEEILQKRPVGVTDNFFSLGGDSLKATRTLAKLSSEFEVELPAVSLFLNPTAEQLSLEITRTVGEDTEMLEELLAEIEGISDEDVRRQLE